MTNEENISLGFKVGDISEGFHSTVNSTKQN